MGKEFMSKRKFDFLLSTHTEDSYQEISHTSSPLLSWDFGQRCRIECTRRFSSSHTGPGHHEEEDSSHLPIQVSGPGPRRWGKLGAPTSDKTAATTHPFVAATTALLFHPSQHTLSLSVSRSPNLFGLKWVMQNQRIALIRVATRYAIETRSQE